MTRKEFLGWLLVFALVAVIALGIVPRAHSQAVDNAIYVKQFQSQGNNVGALVTAAMQSCPAAPLPCILVIDPSLAAWANGTMPTLCANCYLSDWRKGVPSGQNYPVNPLGYQSVHAAVMACLNAQIPVVLAGGVPGCFVNAVESGALGSTADVIGSFDPVVSVIGGVGSIPTLTPGSTYACINGTPTGNVCTSVPMVIRLGPYKDYTIGEVAIRHAFDFEGTTGGCLSCGGTVVTSTSGSNPAPFVLPADGVLYQQVQLKNFQLFYGSTVSGAIPSGFYADTGTNTTGGFTNSDWCDNVSFGGSTNSQAFPGGGAVLRSRGHNAGAAVMQFLNAKDCQFYRPNGGGFPALTLAGDVGNIGFIGKGTIISAASNVGCEVPNNTPNLYAGSNFWATSASITSIVVAGGTATATFTGTAPSTGGPYYFAGLTDSTGIQYFNYEPITVLTAGASTFTFTTSAPSATYTYSAPYPIFGAGTGTNANQNVYSVTLDSDTGQSGNIIQQLNGVSDFTEDRGHHEGCVDTTNGVVLTLGGSGNQNVTYKNTRWAGTVAQGGSGFVWNTSNSGPQLTMSISENYWNTVGSVLIGSSTSPQTIYFDHNFPTVVNPTSYVTQVLTAAATLAVGGSRYYDLTGTTAITALSSLAGPNSLQTFCSVASGVNFASSSTLTLAGASTLTLNSGQCATFSNDDNFGGAKLVSTNITPAPPSITIGRLTAPVENTGSTSAVQVYSLAIPANTLSTTGTLLITLGYAACTASTAPLPGCTTANTGTCSPTAYLATTNTGTNYPLLTSPAITAAKPGVTTISIQQQASLTSGISNNFTAYGAGIQTQIQAVTANMGNTIYLNVFLTNSVSADQCYLTQARAEARP